MKIRFNIISKLFAFSITLLLVRVFKTQHYSFFFLVWNLFLAWLPYWIICKYQNFKSKMGQLIVIGLTLLFLPNAPYIVTDLFHLSKNLIAPLWFDLILILNFSLLGLLFFLLTTERLLIIIAPFFKSGFWFNSVKFLIILSNGYGIYLGRYLRFNSWDIISNPDDLSSGIFHSIFDTDNYKETISVTITFTIFLYLVFEMYESFKKRIGEKQNELL